ncbi:hypothetical protein [Deinococcus gobiensis]|uniref:Uncharacterized protein n=1 Tax=Deinococcus gobiensis (strain DSM 21396 / JCM 16679 / CGMCC 1.7299 / I-0) TaxID=745776 RepID=H8H2L3_DEIGI|nr:hypothetical protein [Deinococcus gobiensis]AFD27760.1 hypothetical protein DGo_PB0491 [Deinococcus gobiensis I-0]
MTQPSEQDIVPMASDQGKKRRKARAEAPLVIRHHHPEVPDEKVLAAARRLVMNSVPSSRAAQAEAKRPA